ncbi:MAG: ABC transporter ATP-binding protein, partial [Pseudomonadota bacterium]
ATFARSFCGAARDVARALRFKVGVAVSATRRARRPRQLSGGQQQRVALARALAAEPDVLLCDQITSALNVTVQAQVLAVLKRLQKDRGIACLFISHDLAVVSEISHQILFLEGGELREYGPTQRVIGAPESAYSRKLLSAHGPRQHAAE